MYIKSLQRNIVYTLRFYNILILRKYYSENSILKAIYKLALSVIKEIFVQEIISYLYL